MTSAAIHNVIAKFKCAGFSTITRNGFDDPFLVKLVSREAYFGVHTGESFGVSDMMNVEFCSCGSLSYLLDAQLYVFDTFIATDEAQRSDWLKLARCSGVDISDNDFDLFVSNLQLSK